MLFATSLFAIPVVLAACAAMLGLRRRRMREKRLAAHSAGQITRYADLYRNGAAANNRSRPATARTISQWSAQCYRRRS